MANPAIQRIYEFGDFRLDASHLMLSCRESELQLAPKAVETLLALIERRGEIISKDDLLETVWPDTAVEESNLFLYLSVLRKTLGTQPNGDPWIETLRRRGYRFNGLVRVATSADATYGTVGIEALGDTAPGSKTPSKPRWLSRPVLLTVTGLLAAAAVLAFAYPYFTNRPLIGSIAVMPFDDESGKAELRYLPESITEALVGKLSKVPELQVRSSTAIFLKYRDRKVDAKTVGEEMSVRAVLYGKLLKRADDTVLNLELVDTQTERSLWNHTYGKEFLNPTTGPPKFAIDVIRELNIKLSPEVERKLARNYTESSDAYALFQKGRIYLRRLKRQEVERGIEEMQRAIDVDPSFALAYAGLAEAYRALAIGAEADPLDAFPKSRAAALKALELDENLAEGHAAIGLVSLFYEWDFKSAEKSILRALELDPGSSVVNSAYAELASRMGRKDEAARYRQRSWELDQLSPMIITFAADTVESPDESLERLRIALDLDPNFYFAHYSTGRAYRRKKMYAEALAAYERASSLAPDQTWTIATGLVPLLIETGKRDEAEKILSDLSNRSRTRFISSGNLAIICRQLGKIDESYEWLEKGYQQRDPRMVMLKSAPNWNELQRDPRMQDLVRRIGL